jgi:hypothetical protein
MANILNISNIKNTIYFFKYFKKVLKEIFDETLYIIDTIIYKLYKLYDSTSFKEYEIKLTTGFIYLYNNIPIANITEDDKINYNTELENQLVINTIKKHINNPIIINIFRDFNNYLIKYIDSNEANRTRLINKLKADIENYKLNYKYIIINNNESKFNNNNNNIIINNNKNLIHYDNHLIFNNNDINYKYSIIGYIDKNKYFHKNTNKISDYIIYEFETIVNKNSFTNNRFEKYDLNIIKLNHKGNSCYINSIIILLFNSKNKAIFDLLYFLTPITYNDSQFNHNIIDEDTYYNHVLELKEKLLSSFFN